MQNSFVDILEVGGHKNSLGRVNDVIKIVLSDKSRLPELYEAIFNEDAWVRMRAIDGLEKICRQHPEWVEPYIDSLQEKLSNNTQPSIQWHLAEIYTEVILNDQQKERAIIWLKGRLATVDVDWIVSANCMQALAKFARSGDVELVDLQHLLHVQRTHHSKAVVKKADKILTEFS